MLIKEKIGELFLKNPDGTDICKLNNVSSSELVLNNSSNIKELLCKKTKTLGKNIAFKFDRNKMAVKIQYGYF